MSSVTIAKNSGSVGAKSLHNVACPFCSLLCDDLSLSSDGDNLKVTKNGCAQSIAGFAKSRIAASPMVAGVPTSQHSAVKQVARILRTSERPLFSGLCTDVEGMRETVHLAEKSKGIIDHAGSSGFDSGVRILQSRGWYMTTLAEVRNRADLVVIVGADLVDHYGNFLRRVLEPKQTLNPQRRKDRRVVYIGKQADAPKSTKNCAIERLECAPQRLAEVIGMLRAAVAGRKLQDSSIAAGLRRQIAALAVAIGQAKYPVFVWAPGHLTDAPADLTILAVTRLIDDLNRSQRAAGLALGGDNGGMTAANVCAWLTGFPMHISYSGKTIDYDPVRYRTNQLLAGNAVDTLVWIDAFGYSPAPTTAANVKRIIISAAADLGAQAADVYIPVGIPGVDYSGRLIRTDAVVSIHLDQIRQRKAPSVRGVVHAILDQLA